MIALKKVTLIGRFKVHVFDKDFLPRFFFTYNLDLIKSSLDVFYSLECILPMSIFVLSDKSSHSKLLSWCQLEIFIKQLSLLNCYLLIPS